jgi:hypothetical protein
VKLGCFAAIALAVAGCSSSSTGHGRASLWITRDRGAHVLLVRQVPAGETAMEALQRVAKVKTRYGGRFVQAIDGIEGSLSKRRDWFYFVNGYEADRGAAEYTLRAGDVEWWDYRSWAKEMRVPVVVGAFPEPFLHGYNGNTRPATVLAPSREARRRLGSLIGARAGKNPNVLSVRPGLRTRFEVEGGETPGAPVRFRFVGDWHQLLRRPFSFRYRYAVP